MYLPFHETNAVLMLGNLEIDLAAGGTKQNNAFPTHFASKTNICFIRTQLRPLSFILNFHYFHNAMTNSGVN